MITVQGIWQVYILIVVHTVAVHRKKKKASMRRTGEMQEAYYVL